MNEKVVIDVGNIRGITRRIDDANRLTLPKEYIDALNIEKNAMLEIFLTENGMYIRKVETSILN